MHLFERVKKIAKNFAGSDAALAKKLGYKQQTFFGYLNEKRQDNLWPILPHVLELFPELNRDWLYFGEGEMLASDAPAETAAASDCQRRITELEAELKEERALNRRLTERLLEMGNK